MTIHDRALEITARFKKSELELVNIIQEVDSLRAYLEKGFTSSFDYCVSFLGLSESCSFNFISVARKSGEVPALKEAIENHQITVSKAKKISSVITKDNATHWLGLAQTLPKSLLEKEVAKVNPQVLTPEKAKYVSESRLKLELGVSEEVMKDLRRAQEILSQKNRGHVTLEEALGKVLREFVKREDPVEKAKRASGRKEVADQRTDQRVPGPVKSQEIPFFRSPLNASLNHQVTLRDNNQCTHIHQDGRRCSQRKWLEKHHIIPIREGGQNNLENIKTLCFYHHQLKHKIPGDGAPGWSGGKPFREGQILAPS